jgi:hypothetical protein
MQAFTDLADSLATAGYLADAQEADSRPAAGTPAPFLGPR